MPSELRFEAGDIVVCVDGEDAHGALTYGKPYLVSRGRYESSFVHLADGPPGGWVPSRFRRARLDEIVEYAKTNPRPFFKVGDLVTCVNSDDSGAGLTVGQTYRVTDAYAGQFISTAGALLEEAKHQYVGVAWADGRRRIGQSSLRFRQATPAEIETFNKEKGAASPTTPSPTTSSPTTSGLGPVVVQCQADIARANAAMAIPPDGYLKSSDGREFGIVDWKPSSCLGNLVEIDVKLQPEVPKAPNAAEAPKASEPVGKLYVGQQVVLSAKGLQNKELRKFLGGVACAIIDHVRSDGTIWIARPQTVTKVTAGRQTVLADEIVPVERDYYLVPMGTVIEKGDEWWEQGAWRSASYSVGTRLLIPAPLRRRKPNSLHGHTIKANEFVKVLGPSRELGIAPYWNPLMSNMIGKVYCVSEIVAYASGPAISISDENSTQWTLMHDWVSRPSEGEIKAYQDSLAKVGNVVLCSSFDEKGRFYRICEVETKPSGDVVVLVESETLVQCHVSPRAFWRLATEDEASRFTAGQDDLRKAREKEEAAEPAPTITRNTPESLPFSEMEMEFKWGGRFKDESAAASSAFKGLQKAMKDKITIVSEGIKIEGVVASLASSGLSTEGQMNMSLKVIPTSVTVEKKAPPAPQAEPAPKSNGRGPAEPGEGYRFLEPGELVVEGDEWYVFSGWRKSANYLGDRKQAWGNKYRRRNKFTEGELVRIIKPLPGMHRQSGISWVPAMDKYDGGVFTIHRLDTDGTYGLVEGNNPYWYAPSWLAPASSSQREGAEKAPKSSGLGPAEPGEGYRFLDPEELVVEGDEFYLPSGLWVSSVSWAVSDRKQGAYAKYRRRNKFAEGELVRIIKPLDTTQRPTWLPAMDRLDGKTGTVRSVDRDGDYRLVGNPFWYNPSWLAPASSSQREEAEKALEPSSQCPAEPGEGYRFLDPEELVVEGDEYWCTDSHKWCLSSNYCRTGKQGVGTKYRRRNKFTEGELVRLVKPLDTSVGPGWMSCFDRWIEADKLLTITEVNPKSNYMVAESRYHFAPNWLAPASSEQKAKKAQIAELESKMKDIQSQLDSLRK